MTGPPRRSLRTLSYHSLAKPELGCEIFTLQSLYARRAAMGDPLDNPTRLAFDIIYIGTRGRGAIGIDFVDMPVGRGLATFFARGRVQIFHALHGVDAWMLLLRPDFLRRDVRWLSPDRAKPYVAIAGAVQRELLATCDQLAAEYARPADAVQPALCAALVSAIVLRLERLEDDEPRPSATLAKFRAAVETDFARTRSVAHYARAVGVSERVLHTACAAAGASPKQLIDRRVALEAQRLLAHTAASVKELAADLGFSEPTNFVRFFARHAGGETPADFRKRLSGRGS